MRMLTKIMLTISTITQARSGKTLRVHPDILVRKCIAGAKSVFSLEPIFPRNLWQIVPSHNNHKRHQTANHPSKGKIQNIDLRIDRHVQDHRLNYIKDCQSQKPSCLNSFRLSAKRILEQQTSHQNNDRSWDQQFISTSISVRRSAYSPMYRYGIRK